MDCTKERIKWVDIAKGIAILSVVVGHTIRYGNTGPIIKTMIYTFHMPFFFIMSGLTATPPSSVGELRQKTKKLALSLLVPAYVAYICKTFLCILLNKSIIDISYFFNQLYSLLFIDAGNANYQDYITYSFGYVWFLPSLFLCRTLFSYLNLIFNRHQLPLIICILSILGYILGSQQKHFLFSFDIALTVLPLLLFGYYFKKWDISKNSLLFAFFSLLIWVICLFILYPHPARTYYLNIISRDYPFYPLCFFVAIAGTLFVCYFSFFFAKIKVSDFVAFIGKNSMSFLLIHYFDFLWTSICESFSDQYIRTIARLSIDIIIFLIVMLIKLTFIKLKTREFKNGELYENGK